MQKIHPFLWFDGQAEEAAGFYTSVFKNSKVTNVMRNGDGGALTVSFELEGQPFTALNGGPEFKFTPAISFYVDCQTQAEVDELWDKLLEGGGAPDQCGWLRDRYGVSWQIIPSALPELLQDPDPTKAQRVMGAMMQMVKIDIAGLQAAARG